VATECVYATSGGEIDFLVAREGVLSRLAAVDPGDRHESKRRRHARIEKVKSISLNDLLARSAAPGRIDFLSLDTEGSEFAILQAVDFGRWDIRAIAVKHNFTPARERILDLLTANGFRRKWPEFTCFDDWYVRR